MADRIRSPVDRRSMNDRRKAYKIGYFLKGGVERRNVKDRRSKVDRRSRLSDQKAAVSSTVSEDPIYSRQS